MRWADACWVRIAVRRLWSDSPGCAIRDPLLALLALGVLTAVGAWAADWPQYQWSSGKDGSNVVEMVGQLEAKATMPVDSGFSGGSYGPAGVFSSAGVAVAGDEAYVSGMTGNLVAFDRRSGVEAWRVVRHGPVRGTPAVLGEMVLVGSSDGFLSFYDRGTAGSVFRTIDAGGAQAASPTTANVKGQVRVYLAGTDGRISCADAESGSLYWSATVGGAIWGAPSVNEATRRVYVGSYDQRVHCYDAVSGREIWSSVPASIPLGPIRSSVVVNGSHLYVATVRKGLVVLNDAGAYPTLAWRPLFFTGSHTGSVAVVTDSGGVVGSTLFVADISGRLMAFLDAGLSGSFLWERDLPAGAGIVGPPVVAGGRVFVGAEDGILRGFDCATGLHPVEVSASAAVDSSLAAAHGAVFLTTALGVAREFGNLLEPPISLSAIAVGEAVALNWIPATVPPANVVPVSGYRVYRSVRPDAGFVAVAYVNGTADGVSVSAYVDATLPDFGTYYYAVTSLHDVGPDPGLEESTYSDIATASVFFSPAEVNVLTALGGDGIVPLTWSVVPGTFPVSRVLVFRREGYGDFALSRTVWGAPSRVDDLRVENGLAYGYVLQAVDDHGRVGPATREVTATPMTVDWPMFQGDDLHGAYDPHLDLELPLGETWRAALAPAGGVGFSGYQTAVVVGGTVFATSVGGDVVALRADTGGTIWWQSGYVGVASSPAVYDGLVYVTHSGGLSAFDVATGAEVWSLPGSANGSHGADDAGVGEESSPIVYKGVLAYGALRDGVFKLVAIDLDPASSRYRHVIWTAGSGYWFVKASPAGGRGHLYMVSGDGQLTALDPFTGIAVWARSLGAYVSTTETVNLNVVPPVVLVAHESGSILAYNADTGDPAWTHEVNCRFTGPAIAGNTVFIASDQVNTVYALNAASGALVWMARTFFPQPGITQGGPMIAGHQLHVYATNGQLFTLDLATGTVLDIARLSNVQLFAAHLSGGAGHLFVPSRDGRLVAVGHVPPPPLRLLAVGGIGEVTLTWVTAPPGGVVITGYRLYRADAAQGGEILVGTISGAGATRYVDTSMPKRTPVYYRLAAVNAQGVEVFSAGPVPALAYYPPNVVALITEPAPNERICVPAGQPAQITVVGTATSGNFLYYLVDYVVDGQTVWANRFTYPVTAGVLATITGVRYGAGQVRLTVVDELGDPVGVAVHVTVPSPLLVARLTSPGDQDLIPTSCGQPPYATTLTVEGNASGVEFASYRLEVARAAAPTVILSSVTSTTPVAVSGEGVLGTVSFPDCDDFLLRLVVVDTCGRERVVAARLTLQSSSEFLVSLISFSAKGSGAGEHRRPMDVSVDRKDYVWVADTGNRRVQKYTSDGRFLFEVGEHETGSATGVVFGEPVAAAVDTANQLLVLDRLNGVIVRLDPDGQSVDTIGGGPGSGQLLQPAGLGVRASTGAICVADTNQDRVVELAADGTLVTAIGGPGMEPFLNHPNGAQYDEFLGGNLLVADTHRDRVMLLTPAGLTVTAFGSSGSAPGEFSFPWEALETRPDHLFVSEVQNDRISWLSHAGNVPRVVTLLPPLGFGKSCFKQPHGLARNADGSLLYVADTGNNRIVGIRIRRTTMDTVAPDAAITSPADGAAVGGRVSVLGTAADAHFASYTLAYASGGAPSDFTTVAISATPVWGSKLATWDTGGLPIGDYILRLTVTDQAGHMSLAQVSVTVGAPLIVSAAVLPASFMPDRSGLEIAYQLGMAAAVTACVLAPHSNHPIWMGQAAAGGYGGMAGANTMAWDGRDEHGLPVAPGAYTAVVFAKAGALEDRRTLSVLASLSPEAQAAALGGPRGSGGGHAAGSVPSGGANPSTSGGSASGGSTAGASIPVAGGTATDPASGAHDNGWHNGNNPNGFTVNHPDNSQGHGNNHH